MQVEAHAKINWTLAIRRRNGDGYHELDTVMQAIALTDSVEIAPTEDRAIHVVLRGLGAEGIPADETNSAHRAASLYAKESHLPLGFSIAIEKRIPSEAGLGGGSADAAAVLRALEDAYCALGEAHLFQVARQIGADVPFCLHGGAARCRGVGEIMESVPARSLPLLIAKPFGGVSTRTAFEAFDAAEEGRSPAPNAKTERLLSALRNGTVQALPDTLFNDLTAVSIALHPAIGACLDRLREAGAVAAAMSGSGSACFGVFESDESAHNALPFFLDYPFACATRTVASPG